MITNKPNEGAVVKTWKTGVGVLNVKFGTNIFCPNHAVRGDRQLTDKIDGQI